MPRYQEPMKDVISCEKLRGGANIHQSVDVRMRELIWQKEAIYLCTSKVVHKKGTWGTETSKYP
jgi:hypothetical protein